MLMDMSETTDFAKICKANRKYTIESGQYMARRYLSICDSYSWDNGNICANEESLKKLNVSSGTFNMEHFIINRDFKYSLYDEDGKKCAEISLPRKYRKYIATIANYLILENEINANLKNRPVYEKIDMLEQEISNKGIDMVIPSKRSQLHFYQIKSYLHDACSYPKKELDRAETRKEREELLKNYYLEYFEEEFLDLARTMDNEDIVYKYETREKLLKLGFVLDKDSLVYDADTSFSEVEAIINPKGKNITLSVEVYNPYYGTTEDVLESEKGYNEIIEKVKSVFVDRFKRCPAMESSNDYGGSEDESITFSYNLKMNENNIKKFIDAVKIASDSI